MIFSTLIGWAVAVGAPVIAALATPPAHRRWAWRVAALVVLYVIALLLAGLSQVAAVWASAIAAAAVLLTTQPLIAVGMLTRQEIGLVPPRRPSARAALVVIIAALAFNAVVLALRDASPVQLPPSALLALLLAAPLEELVFRGALLALADRALPPRWQVAGAPVGPGGVVVSVSFIALHGASAGMLAGIVPAALLYLWLRAYTGSLVAPILAHLAWNLVVVLMH